jgi:hypothetical protein
MKTASILVSLVLVLCLGAVARAAAVDISADIGPGGTYGPQDKGASFEHQWLIGSPSGPTDYANGSAELNPVTFEGISFQLQGSGSFNHIGPRGADGWAAADPAGDMAEDYVKCDGSDDIVLNITLDPGSYTLVGYHNYSHSSFSAYPGSSYAVTVTASGAATASGSGTTIQSKGATDAQIMANGYSTIDFTVASTGTVAVRCDFGGGSALSGFHLTPEPTSAILLLIGLPLVARRRHS